MSVPLDRLYNFLDDLVNQDTLIYRQWPMGSKNLNDFCLTKEKTPLEIVTKPPIVMHDQEPLEMYSDQDIINLYFSRQRYNWFTREEFSKSIMDRGLIEKLFREITNNLSIYDQYILVHSEKNSNCVEKYRTQGAIPVYYWSHALIAGDWFRYANNDPQLFKNKTHNRDFLIYNRAWAGTREYRLKFSELVVENNLSSKCLMGFSATDNDIHYTHHRFNNKELEIKRNDLENYFFKNNSPSTASADYDSKDYQSCMIEVVLETLFDDSRQHLTEKALRPIACGSPFILVSCAGSLEYLRSYGFRTFNKLIDESYDNIQDSVQRLECIVDLMKSLSQWTDKRKQKFINDTKSITEHNHRLFFSKKFFDHVVNEYKNNLESALITLEESKKGILLDQRLTFINRLFDQLGIVTDDVVKYAHRYVDQATVDQGRLLIR